MKKFTLIALTALFFLLNCNAQKDIEDDIYFIPDSSVNTNKDHFIRHFIAVSMGASIPLKSHSDILGGGAYFSIDGSFYFYKNLGVTVSLLASRNNYFEYREKSAINDKRYTVGAVAGLLFSIPLSSAICWDFNAMAGSVAELDIYNSTPFLFTTDLGTTFRVDLGEGLSLFWKADFIFTEFSKNYPSGRLKLMPIRIGLAFNL